LTQARLLPPLLLPVP